jgi:uncharacterized protein (DUF2344 family)
MTRVIEFAVRTMKAQGVKHLQNKVENCLVSMFLNDYKKIGGREGLCDDCSHRLISRRFSSVHKKANSSIDVVNAYKHELVDYLAISYLFWELPTFFLQ